MAKAKVQKNYHVTLGENWHHYSVPFGFIGKLINAVYDTDTVEIYYAHQRIALHKRSYKPHDFTTIKGATIITSQLPVKAWYEYIKEPTLADAIMDRLTAHANRIELKGESLRRKKNS